MSINLDVNTQSDDDIKVEQMNDNISNNNLSLQKKFSNLNKEKENIAIANMSKNISEIHKTTKSSNGNINQNIAKNQTKLFNSLGLEMEA